jgi:hypothetical protein
MMRVGSAALAALVFLAAPAPAQPVDAVRMERVAAEAARWTQQLNAALTAGSEGFDELNRQVLSLLESGLSREKMAAAAPGLRRLIERNRDNVRRSDAMLASLPAYPSAMPADIPAERLVAETRAQNGRLMDLLVHYDAFIVAMAAGDHDALNRVRPKLTEGVFALLGQQRLMFQNRQASIPATDSSHQALGIATQIYRAMIAVAFQGLAAREGAAAASAAAALGDELGLVARDARALAAAGRINLKRELAEFEALRKGSSKDAAQARLAERALAATRLEEKSFEIGDRLAAFADSNTALTAAQLRSAGVRSLLSSLTTLETELLDVGLQQANPAGGAPK